MAKNKQKKEKAERNREYANKYKKSTRGSRFKDRNNSNQRDNYN